VDLSVATSEARVRAAVSSRCIVNATHFLGKTEITNLGKKHPFLLSAIHNVLVGVGPSVEPIMLSSFGDTEKMQAFRPSCKSEIMGNLQFAANGSCSGLGCCEAGMPQQTSPIIRFGVGFMSRPKKPPATWETTTTPCSYSMMVDSSEYNFSTPDLYGYEGLSGRLHRGVPVVLGFAIRSSGGSCPAKGQPKPVDYACVSGNSSCNNAPGGGYVCKCWNHYDGNPYIANGCQGSRPGSSFFFFSKGHIANFPTSAIDLELNYM
jgi:hypothetical protein